MVEVAHPDIIETYAAENSRCMRSIYRFTHRRSRVHHWKRHYATKFVQSGRVIYIGTGAFWGAEDIAKMNERNTLRSLSITMKKHPDSLIS